MTRDSRQPSLELLRTFLLFADKGESKSVSQALGLNEAEISRRLTTLRQKYALIARQGRVLVVTEKGREALPSIRSLLQNHEHLAQWMTQKQPNPSRLTIATGNVSARLYLPRAIAQFREKNPSCQTRIQIRRGRERILGVADGTFDLAIVSHDTNQIQAIARTISGEQNSLRIETLAEFPLCIVAGKGSQYGIALERYLEGQIVPVAKLAEFPLIGLDHQSGIRRQFEAHQAGLGKLLRFEIEAGGWDAAKEFARLGLGVAILPLSLLELSDAATLSIRKLPKTMVVQETLISRNEDRSEKLESLVEAVQSSVKRHREDVGRRWAKLWP